AVPMDFDEPWDGLLVRFDARLIDALSPTVESQRILGLFERPSSTLDEILAEGTTLAIALDGVQDPGNVGTIIRLAAAFEASGVIILTGTADPFGPKAMRASSGTLPLVRVCAASAQELIAGVRDRDLDLFSTAAAGGASEPPPSGGVLVFGSEGKGVSPEVSEASKPLSIPISSRVDSLNVAAAAAILLARSFARRNAKETRR
ncbi:MAG TPA: RNA methyltransferase, partial [Thermoanaerobaculia bacterium]|nr:RNA methyltransferase [Thermoanaerobaculia bacterium]